jgi:hypothetical protein
MLFMVVEYFKPGAVDAIYQRVRERGRLLPDGLEYLDSWVDQNFTKCFQLMRTDRPELFQVWMSAWADLVEFEVVPVQSSASAIASVMKQRSGESP